MYIAVALTLSEIKFRLLYIAVALTLPESKFSHITSEFSQQVMYLAVKLFGTSKFRICSCTYTSRKQIQTAVHIATALTLLERKFRLL